MARFNEILVGRYNRMVQKLLSMKGPATLVGFSDEAVAVFSLFYGVENRYLEGWDRFGVAVGTAAGAAGNRTVWRIRNPGGSNVLIVIEKITIPSALVQQPVGLISAVNTDLTSLQVTTGLRFDARGRGQPAAVISFQNGAVVALPTPGNWQVGVAANTMADIILFEDQEMPLLPGDALTVFSDVTAQSLTVSCFWRERFLEDSERA